MIGGGVYDVFYLAEMYPLHSGASASHRERAYSMPPAVDAHRLSILFCDDDPFYRALAREALEEAGYAVSEAADGNTAAEALAGQVFNLAIIDLDMPGRDGFAVMHSVRGAGPNVATPIIVLTGNEDASAIERAYLAGATSFMVKPVNWQLFVQHVRFMLKAAQSEADLREASRTANYLSEIKSSMLSTLVTEFQAPLRNAFACATLLQQEADGPIASDIYRQAISDVHKMIEQLSTVHLRMLNFGRVLGETVKIDEASWSAEKLIFEVVGSLEERAERRNIVISKRINLPTNTQIHGDRALLSLSLKSLISNAVRFAPRRSTVTVEARMDPQRGLLLTVEDDAPTLSQSQIQEILALPSARPQSSLDQDHDRSTGLTIGRLLVEAHQGELSIAPLPESGNLARMSIPAARIKRYAASAMATASVTPLPERPAASRAAPPVMVKQAGQQRAAVLRPLTPTTATK